MNTSSLLEIVSGKRKGLYAGAIRQLLQGLTPIYRTVVNYRNSKFDSGKNPGYSVDVPVISIGNVTTGGTGKTPMVVWVCRLLKRNGLDPGIVSRGYGSGNSGVSKNDEALELESRLPDIPHVQDPDRVLAAQQCIETNRVSTIVLDDGFQHRRLGRDLDIVLIDASNPFGYDYLLPRGLLREPISSLKRADAIVITRSESVQSERIVEIRQRIEAVTSAPIAVSQTRINSLSQFDGNSRPVASMRPGRWFAFSAIGNPEAFEKSLTQNELDLKGSTRFGDHHWYTDSDRRNITDQARRCGADHLVCTHKDLVKIGVNEMGGIPLFALMIDVEITQGREQLERMIIAAATS